MRREVLPARRRWLTLPTMAIVAALAGCATGLILPVPQSTAAPSPGVPPTVWTFDFGGTCDEPYSEPAVFCWRGYIIVFDDCRWKCEPLQ